MRFRALISPLAVAILTFIACQPTQPNDTVEVVEQYAELENLFEEHPDKTWVVNFWATSCPPCIKEMPHFRELDNAYKDQNVRVLLVSTDKVEDLDSRVYPFIDKYEITPEVVVLGDQNYSAWTDNIDPSWYGALPATMIFNSDQKTFKFGAYKSFEELEADLLRIAAD
jgi:thiol-disulfide isomerase/thioredoxin